MTRPYALRRDVYSGYLKLLGEEHRPVPFWQPTTTQLSLAAAKRSEEAKTLMRKTIPVARRVLGESDETTLRMRSNYGLALCEGAGASLTSSTRGREYARGHGTDRATRFGKRASGGWED